MMGHASARKKPRKIKDSFSSDSFVDHEDEEEDDVIMGSQSSGSESPKRRMNFN